VRRQEHTVVTGNDVAKPKPSLEGLESALEGLGAKPNEALYIGDAHADYEMASAAKVFYLGVASAFSNI
jgi:phosphoglycolate phosphatase-like HAD superfamily hydrolase